MLKFFKKVPLYRFMSKTDGKGETHYFTEKLEKYWPFSYEYFYVQGTLSFDEDRAREIFNDLCIAAIVPESTVLAESETKL